MRKMLLTLLGCATVAVCFSGPAGAVNNCGCPVQVPSTMSQGYWDGHNWVGPQTADAYRNSWHGNVQPYQGDDDAGDRSRFPQRQSVAPCTCQWSGNSSLGSGARGYDVYR